MDSTEIMEAKKLLEQEIYRAINNFELKSSFIVKSISLTA